MGLVNLAGGGARLDDAGSCAGGDGSLAHSALAGEVVGAATRAADSGHDAGCLLLRLAFHLSENGSRQSTHSTSRLASEVLGHGGANGGEDENDLHDDGCLDVEEDSRFCGECFL